jgi:hypothetical protein
MSLKTLEYSDLVYDLQQKEDVMAKGMDRKKEGKKKPAKSLKEKRQEKKDKKKEK